MNKKEPRTCYGCRAVCTISNGGCAFGFKVKKKRVGNEPHTILKRRPAEPCFKVETQKAFLAVAKHLGMG